jgi:N-methylhydantoinase A
VDAPAGPIDQGWLAEVRASFTEIYERDSSRSFSDVDIEIPNIRVRGVGLMPDLRMPDLEPGSSSQIKRSSPSGWCGSSSMANSGR